MTQTSTSRRVATVSGGALLLCLSFGGTALAASTPASGSGSSPVGGLTDPLPLPTPPDTPGPLDAVTQTVHTGTQAGPAPPPTRPMRPPGGRRPRPRPPPRPPPRGGPRGAESLNPASTPTCRS